MNRLFVDLKEDCKGDIVGRVALPKSSTFALEAIAEVVEQLSKNCGVHAKEILDDIKKLVG